MAEATCMCEQMIHSVYCMCEQMIHSVYCHVYCVLSNQFWQLFVWCYHCLTTAGTLLCKCHALDTRPYWMYVIHCIHVIVFTVGLCIYILAGCTHASISFYLVWVWYFPCSDNIIIHSLRLISCLYVSSPYCYSTCHPACLLMLVSADYYLIARVYM